VEQRILAVRATREACITNTALLGQVNDQMLGYLDELEASLAAYFEGKSTEETFPLAFTLCPPTNYTPEITLFWFGTNVGFELPPASQWVRTSVLPSELKGSGKPDKRVVVRLSKPAEAETEALKALDAAKADERGLPYRIPARTFVQAVLDGRGWAEVLAHGEVLMAQWGLITHLPPNVGSPGSTFKPVYYTETGALKELAVTGTPLSPEPLDSLGKAAGSVTDAQNAHAAKDGELDQLKRQRAMLEEKVRIQELQDQLKAP
jgi:hypothetical protein